jgi:hypothetical protein
MSTGILFEAAVAKQRWLAYRRTPSIAPVEANDLLVLAFADANGLSLETASTWDQAFTELSAMGQLAENRNQIQVEKPQPAAVEVAPVVVETDQERLHRIRRATRSENPAVRHAADDELRRITAPPQDGESQTRWFMRAYPRVVLSRFSQDQLQYVIQKYGAKAVSASLNNVAQG